MSDEVICIRRSGQPHYWDVHLKDSGAADPANGTRQCPTLRDLKN